MAAHDAGVPLPRADPGQLAPWPARPVADPGQLAADVALLREGGYLKLAVPVRLGGAGLNLRQVACAQRRLAARAPAAAFAVNAHHAWVGAAADTLASGGPADPVAGWLLREAARGGFIAGWPGPATAAACELGDLEALAGDPPGWDWAGTPVTDDSRAGRPARGYAFIRRPGSPGPVPAMPPGPPGPPGDALVAGMFSWALPLAGMTWYGTGRRAFGRVLAATLSAHGSAAFDVGVPAGLGGDATLRQRGSGLAVVVAAEEAGEHVDEFEQQRVYLGLLVSGVLGAVAGDEPVPPCCCLLLMLGGLVPGLVAGPPPAQCFGAGHGPAGGLVPVSLG